MRCFSRNRAIEAGIRTSVLQSDSAFQDAAAMNAGFKVQQENRDRVAIRDMVG